MTCEYIFSPNRDIPFVGVIQGSFPRAEPHEINWWGVEVEIHIAAPPRDEWGDFMVWCAGGHWSSKRHFTKGNTSNNCKDCAKLQAHRWRMTAATDAGRVLRDKPGRPPKHDVA